MRDHTVKKRQGIRTDLPDFVEIIPESSKGRARDQAGSLFGVSGRYVATAAKHTAPPRTSRKARTRSLYPLGGRYSEKRAYHENYMYLQPQAWVISAAASGL